MHVLLATTQLYFPSAQIIPKKGIWMEVGGMMGNYLSCSAAVCNDSRGVIRTVLTQWTITPLHTYWRVHQTKKKRGKPGGQGLWHLEGWRHRGEHLKVASEPLPLRIRKRRKVQLSGDHLKFFQLCSPKAYFFAYPPLGQVLFWSDILPPKNGNSPASNFTHTPQLFQSADSLSLRPHPLQVRRDFVVHLGHICADGQHFFPALGRFLRVCDSPRVSLEDEKKIPSWRE